MHGREETSYLPRTVWTVAHLAIVLMVAWMYFGGGIAVVASWFGQVSQPGDVARRTILFAFAVVLWVRMTTTAYLLLNRRFDWSECIAVIGAVAFYQFGFALFGGATVAPLDAVDLVAVGLFVLGSLFNTGAELQRKRFKADPANMGKLYTKGLFGLVRHPNYLGDVLWALGWAFITRNAWALLIPIVAASGFVFMFIPQLSVYLAERYGAQYDDWARRTKRLVPFVY